MCQRCSVIGFLLLWRQDELFMSGIFSSLDNCLLKCLKYVYAFTFKMWSDFASFLYFWTLELDVKFSFDVNQLLISDTCQAKQQNLQVLFQSLFCFRRCFKVEGKIIDEEFCWHKKLNLLLHPSNWKILVFIALLAM